MGKPRDPLLDCPAVKMFRDVIHLQLNHIQRQEVARRVQCTDKGLRLWEATLTEHMLHGWNPKDVLKMLKTWELMYYN